MSVSAALSKGYFPKELPSVITSVRLGQALASYPGAERRKWTQPAEVNLARPGALRRRLSIPNPSSQFLTASLAVEHWKSLQPVLLASGISISRPRIASEANARWLRYVRDARDRPRLRLERTLGGRFLVRADISEFYRSIYTHSLEWAVDSKEKAKKRVKEHLPPTTGGLLDQAVRNGQDGQTVGLPVGPDTSLLFAELVLCHLDAELQKFNERVAKNALRFMDDFEFAASSRSEAEEVLLCWETLLSDFGLALNQSKTVIHEGLVPIEGSWVVELSQFSIREESDLRTATDLSRYFSKAIQLSHENPTERVLAYALGRVRRLNLGRESWRQFQRVLLAACMAEPSLLGLANQFLGEAVAAGRFLDREAISETLHAIVIRDAPLEHGLEVAWSMSILASLGLPLEPVAQNAVSKMRDNSCLLILEQVAKDSDLEDAKERVSFDDSWKSSDWMLAYEYMRTGKIGRPASEDGVWKYLLDQNVPMVTPPVAWARESALGGRSGRGGMPRPGSDRPPTEMPGFDDEEAGEEGGGDNSWLDEDELNEAY